MRIIGHGIDVVAISAIKDELDTPSKKWMEQFCSAAERAHADKPPVHYRYYAGRFAAKEAVVKALGTGFTGDITWRGIEILRGESGAACIRLSDEVLQLANSKGITEWLI